MEMLIQCNKGMVEWSDFQNREKYWDKGPRTPNPIQTRVIKSQNELADYRIIA
jgi:hypothetical protein